MYRFLAEKAGISIDKLKINMIFRDWSKSKAKYEKDYPNQVETLDIDVWGLFPTSSIPIMARFIVITISFSKLGFTFWV